MQTDPTITYGILKCRDLVQLYYGARLVVDVRQNAPALSMNVWSPLLPQDPRRIRYEIIVENTDAAKANLFDLGVQGDFDNASTLEFSIAPNDTLRIVRGFLDDLEGVVLQQWCKVGSGNLFVSTRETFLTPAPVDEGP